MADDTNTTFRQGRPERADRGPRQSGGRDSGGFRIRLSDNEMQAARTLQEAFNLRSTVAVLGFSLRTLAQLLEEGKLDELISQARAQGGGRPAAERGERRAERDRGPAGRGPRIDPFARPSRPAPAAAVEASVPEQPDGEAPAAVSSVASDGPAEESGDAAAVSPEASEATPAES